MTSSNRLMKFLLYIRNYLYEQDMNFHLHSKRCCFYAKLLFFFDASTSWTNYKICWWRNSIDWRRFFSTQISYCTSHGIFQTIDSLQLTEFIHLSIYRVCQVQGSLEYIKFFFSYIFLIRWKRKFMILKLYWDFIHHHNLHEINKLNVVCRINVFIIFVYKKKMEILNHRQKYMAFHSKWWFFFSYFGSENNFFCLLQ